MRLLEKLTKYFSKIKMSKLKILTLMLCVFLALTFIFFFVAPLEDEQHYYAVFMLAIWCLILAMMYDSDTLEASLEKNPVSSMLLNYIDNNDFDYSGLNQEVTLTSEKILMRMRTESCHEGHLSKDVITIKVCGNELDIPESHKRYLFDKCAKNNAPDFKAEQVKYLESKMVRS